ncbi:MAG: hypothetical protein J3K34DRAFT_417783 [Monoraphidium minutum]|nr:MAG: hypothetical protein J3K34DRAFT_417783 [Monoraphidium minutum]
MDSGNDAAGAAADISAAIDQLAAALHRLAVRNRPACCLLLGTNLETAAPAAPAGAHWRSELRHLQAAPAAAPGYWPAAARLRRMLVSEAAALAVLAAALRGILSATQAARCCVYSWPFFPSPPDIMAALQRDRDAAAAGAVAAAGALAAAGDAAAAASARAPPAGVGAAKAPLLPRQ